MAEPHLFQLRRGSGEPLLLIMGMAGHHRVWGEDFLRLLEAHFDVLAFDHRGIGESGRAATRFRVTDLAGDALRVLDAAGWDSAHVFGISLGGMVAQELALTHPERVRTLALGCTYPGVGGDLDAPGPMRFAEVASSGASEDAVVRTMFEVNFSRGYAAVDEHWRTFREDVLSVRVPLPVTMMQLQAAMLHDAMGRLPQLRVPTLVLHGTADEMLLFSNGKRIADLVPGARLEVFDGAGHLFWRECPDRTVELLRAHAARG